MVDRIGKGPRAATATVVLLSLLLTGCSGAQATPPSASPMSSAGPSAPKPTPTPTPTPTATAVDPNDPTSWIIGFTSVGPMVIGSELSAATQAMTAFTSSNAFTGCPSIVSFDKPGFPDFVITDDLDDGIVELIALQGGPTASEFTATSPRTSSGIGIGADELTAAYPEITYRDDHVAPHYALPDGYGNWINFAVYEGLVNKIVVRPRAGIPREICGWNPPAAHPAATRSTTLPPLCPSSTKR